MTQVQLKVEMTCGSCENAVRNSISKNLGDEVQNLEIDLPNKLVKIDLKSDKFTKEQVVEIVSRCGERAVFFSDYVGSICNDFPFVTKRMTKILKSFIQKAHND